MVYNWFTSTVSTYSLWMTWPRLSRERFSPQSWPTPLVDSAYSRYPHLLTASIVDCVLHSSIVYLYWFHAFAFCCDILLYSLYLQSIIENISFYVFIFYWLINIKNVLITFFCKFLIFGNFVLNLIIWQEMNQKGLYLTTAGFCWIF